MATIIYDESLRMGRLVNELLDLARMESGYFNLSDEEVSPILFSKNYAEIPRII